MIKKLLMIVPLVLVGHVYGMGEDEVYGVELKIKNRSVQNNTTKNDSLQDAVFSPNIVSEMQGVLESKEKADNDSYEEYDTATMFEDDIDGFSAQLQHASAVVNHAQDIINDDLATNISEALAEAHNDSVMASSDDELTPQEEANKAIIAKTGGRSLKGTIKNPSATKPVTRQTIVQVFNQNKKRKSTNELKSFLDGVAAKENQANEKKVRFDLSSESEQATHSVRMLKEQTSSDEISNEGSYKSDEYQSPLEETTPEVEQFRKKAIAELRASVSDTIHQVDSSDDETNPHLFTFAYHDADAHNELEAVDPAYSNYDSPTMSPLLRGNVGNNRNPQSARVLQAEYDEENGSDVELTDDQASVSNFTNLETVSTSLAQGDADRAEMDTEETANSIPLKKCTQELRNIIQQNQQHADKIIKADPNSKKNNNRLTPPYRGLFLLFTAIVGGGFVIGAAIWKSLRIVRTKLITDDEATIADREEFLRKNGFPPVHGEKLAVRTPAIPNS